MANKKPIDTLRDGSLKATTLEEPGRERHILQRPDHPDLPGRDLLEVLTDWWSSPSAESR